jgi:hypothetical protein
MFLVKKSSEMEKSFDFIFFEKYEDTIETKFLEMGK